MKVLLAILLSGVLFTLKCLHRIELRYRNGGRRRGFDVLVAGCWIVSPNLVSLDLGVQGCDLHSEQSRRSPLPSSRSNQSAPNQLRLKPVHLFLYIRSLGVMILGISLDRL